MLIERLRLKNILSFRDATIELGPLNVLIGPNGVGKSNLIEVIGLLQALPVSLANAIIRGGGIRQWLWLGDDLPVTAGIECTFRLDGHEGPLEYGLSFTGVPNAGYTIKEERLGRYFTRRGNNANAHIHGPRKAAIPMGISPNESLISEFKNPADVTPITALGQTRAKIQIFREFRTGPNAQARVAIPTTMPKDALRDGADNLAMVLNDLEYRGLGDRINGYLKRFCERFEAAKVESGDGQARTNLRELGLHADISAARMSDGTLKFLALLVALFNPNQPPLMCIEEPELGLHPDALQLVAEVLLEASQGMQLIVTTHSDALIDALTDKPETVLVCERGFDNGTQLMRLSRKKLALWLKQYTLGEMWRKGVVGGGRR